jgi:hypothetical protein
LNAEESVRVCIVIHDRVIGRFLHHDASAVVGEIVPGDGGIVHLEELDSRMKVVRHIVIDYNIVKS